MSPQASIVIDNLQEGEVLAYPLVLLEGRILNLNSPDTLFLVAHLDDACTSLWPISPSGCFKAFVLLPSPGQFTITLQLDGVATRIFPIEYQRPITRYMLKFHYQICSDADVRNGFDAPRGVANSNSVAIAKIQFNALLLQMAMAELMHSAGLPRRTFSMQFAPDGMPDVTLLRCSFTNAHAHAIDDQELLKLVQKDIEATGIDRHPELESKYAVILGCSRYNTETRIAEGHTALGGDKVAMLGSCGLHTWPSHIGELSLCCLNNTRIDERDLLDDSCFRGTHWATFSTGLGAMLHEIGHTFGLGHATSGIMARGFNDMNRLLCILEADPSSSQLGFTQSSDKGWLDLNHSILREINGRNGAHWNAASAHLLRHSPWISGHARSSLVGPTVVWSNSVLGPVGLGTQNGKEIDLKELNPSSTVEDEIGAIVLDADTYLNHLEIWTRAEVKEREQTEPLRAAGTKHWFLLVSGEYITRVDIRAMAWIDGIQLHTNLRSSRWFGGIGGILHTFKVAEGWHVSAFFGSRGDSYVGKLGLRCLQTPFISSLSHSLGRHGRSSPISKSPLAGKALEDGPKTPFLTTIPEIKAVVVQCGSYVESVKLISLEEAASNLSNPTFYGSNEHVFQLCPGEKLIKLEVSSGHWVDGIRFTTTLRVGPWFGEGRGSVDTVMESPAGHRICGIHGIRGAQYVGAIGALYCADGGTTCPQMKSQERVGPKESEARAFRLMKTVPFSNRIANHLITEPLCGILVAVRCGVVMSVVSYGSLNKYDEAVNDLHSTLLSANDPYQVHCVSLEPGEKLVQIDATFQQGSVCEPYTVIDGICFHTTKRCSSWFGAFRKSNLHFFMAAKGTSIIHVQGCYTGRNLTDLAGFFGVTANSSQLLYPDARVLIDEGADDIRVEAALPEFGIETVVLVEINNGDHLDKDAWTWNQSKMPYPQVWRIPLKMLEDCIESADSKRTLFNDYLICAINSGGAYTKTSAPALRP
ncbi:hypothetical protein CCR75_003598 [Bremia lactucae]|uniref:Jacalin-type lectin domain-containing protein n=1 Tax=Bremia lactucae TaxID=4779 RepID=A0A976IB72_BRELC|nr:hypothetical protein CCR75_003598 [Bremia lactucae]